MTRFVGRHRELELLQRTRARAVQVVGDPGIGKTRLLAEFAAGRGVRVLHGHAAEFEQQVPFGVFATALDGLVTDEQLGLAGRAVERHHVHRAVRRLLEELASERLVLVLDDVHWADDASIGLLDHLVRHPARRVLLVLAHRPRQAPPALVAALARVELIELGPLSRADVAELGGDDAVHDASGGNPFYLEALVRSGGLDRGGVLAGELAALTPVQLRVARAAAVAGDVFDPALVAATADHGLNETLEALDGLAERDVIRATARELRFRHPLLRNAVYQSAGAGWRFAAHGRAAQALRERGAPAVSLAHHVERAAQPGDQQAVAVLLEAAATTLNTAPASAAHWLRASLELHPDDGIRLVALGMLAKALGMTGELWESRDVLHEVLHHLPPGVERARVAGFCAGVEGMLGRHAEARALVLDELATQSGEAAALLKLALAADRVRHGDWAENRDWAAEALAAARDLNDPGLLVGALTAFVQNRIADGVVDPDDHDLLTEAKSLVDGSLDQDLLPHLDSLVHLGWSEVFFERQTDALRHLDRGLRLARASGQHHVITYLLLAKGTALGDIGKLAEANEPVDEAAETAILMRSDEFRTVALAQQCWLATWQGELAEALRLGREAFELGGTVNDWFRAIGGCVLAQVHHYRGDSGACVDLLLRVGGGPDLPNLPPANRVLSFELLAAADGDASWAERAEKLADRLGFPGRRGYAHLAWAHVSGDPRHALSAVDCFSQNEERVSLGRAHLLAANLLGAGDEATHHRERGLAVLTDCGAHLFTRRASVALTPRELAVVELLAQALTAEAIGRRLGISGRTVTKHLENAYRKLGATDRLNAVLKAHELGMLPRAHRGCSPARGGVLAVLPPLQTDQRDGPAQEGGHA
ncbi:AAA family ATPase [Lentzea tibetensis]|uniref:AAA family ATPase n=1 Tax=Lentzea tibetensis TaxID=2591470 RepID=A0A563F1V1_9PSEU|nr:LuxR family transcriptional regulator [Lentzea tibetensis]TWP53899.1 AAA family ATPase [Lentzea tibetensis]